MMILAMINKIRRKIRRKISDIRMIFSRLRNTVTNKERKKITKELQEIEKKSFR